jgi:hypothetical protein
MKDEGRRMKKQKTGASIQGQGASKSATSYFSPAPYPLAFFILHPSAFILK